MLFFSSNLYLLFAVKMIVLLLHFTLYNLGSIRVCKLNICFLLKYYCSNIFQMMICIERIISKLGAPFKLDLIIFLLPDKIPEEEIGAT